MFRLPALPAALALVALACPSLSLAQARDGLAAGVVDFINAASGEYGDEGSALIGAIDAIGQGLAQWDAAVARVENGLAAEIGGAPAPVAARMRTALGAVYFDRGRSDAALEQLDAAVRLDPEFPDAHFLRGLVYHRLNRIAEAGSSFRSAWQRDSQNVTAAYLYLQSTSATADPADTAAALNVLSAAIERGTREPLRFAVSGFLDEGALSAPVFAPAAYSDAFALLAQAQYAPAVVKLREIAATDPLVSARSTESTDLARAVAALKLRDASAAIVAATAAVEKSPSSSEAHRIRGMALLAGRRYADSVASFREAVRLNPRDERSLLAIADVLVESGDPAGARAALGEATRLVPDSGLALWRLGQLHLTFADERSALQAFEKAASLPVIGGAVHLHAAIGRLYHNQLDLDRAAAAYAKRVLMNPDDSAAHIDQGEVRRAQEKLQEALAEYMVAALIDPRSARPFAMMGLVHASEGRDEQAVNMLRKAVALDPGHLEARYALSRALLRLGRADEARQELLVFQGLQSKAMEDERRRVEENQKKIEDTLKRPETPRR
jgi:tetratricopeptide (TPR) repeat protein